jgi:hypothetical protein
LSVSKAVGFGKLQKLFGDLIAFIKDKGEQSQSVCFG